MFKKLILRLEDSFLRFFRKNIYGDFFNKYLKGLVPLKYADRYLNRRDILKDEKFQKIYRLVVRDQRKYTLATMERCYSLFTAVNYIVKRNIPGDIVECGVWKGGSAMLAALTLLELGETSRKIYLYDTYNGMPKPTSKDIDFYGVPYTQLFQSNQSLLSHLEVSLDEVRENMFSTGYPKENLIFIKGMVEDTLSSNLPHSVAVLRLDTDFYESTYYELQNLYPKVSPLGVLIIDDYGHFHGAKEATDKYFNDSGQNIFFQRVDYACRVGLKA